MIPSITMGPTTISAPSPVSTPSTFNMSDDQKNFVSVLLNRINKGSSDTEGIFRISGEKTQVARLLHNFDTNTLPDSFDTYSVHDLVDTLKRIFRERTPLFSDADKQHLQNFSKERFTTIVEAYAPNWKKDITKSALHHASDSRQYCRNENDSRYSWNCIWSQFIAFNSIDFNMYFHALRRGLQAFRGNSHEYS